MIPNNVSLVPDLCFFQTVFFVCVSDICTDIRGRLESVIECRTAKHQGHTKLIWKADIECGSIEDCEFIQQQEEQLLCSDNGTIQVLHEKKNMYNVVTVKYSST